MPSVVVTPPSDTPALAPGQTEPTPADVKDGVTDHTPAETQPDDQRPEWLPEKFSSPEELAKAYDALQKKLGSGETSDAPTPDGTEGDGDGAADDGPAATPDASPDAFTVPGVEQAALDVMRTRLETDGKLADEDYKTFEDAGYPKTVVDAYLAGIQAIQQGAQKAEQDAIDSIGGKETFDRVAEWAAQNFSDAELVRYNRLVSDPETIQIGLEWAVSKYEAVNGKRPQTSVRGGRQEGGDVVPFASQAEAHAAMRDPRYRTDPAYRAEYLARRRVSNF